MKLVVIEKSRYAYIYIYNIESHIPTEENIRDLLDIVFTVE